MSASVWFLAVGGVNISCSDGESFLIAVTCGAVVRTPWCIVARF